MRLTTVILLASLLQVSAATFGQRITLTQRNAPLKSVLKEIRTQSGFNIYYDHETISNNQKIDIDVKDVSVGQALEVAFKELDLSFEIEGKSIAVKKKTPSFLDRVVERFTAIDVRGRVLDENGNPLAGATVIVKGTKTSTLSNLNGEFFLANVSENAVLVISYVGYQTKEIDAKAEMGTVQLILNDSKLDAGYNQPRTAWSPAMFPKDRVVASSRTVGRDPLSKRGSRDFSCVEMTKGLVLGIYFPSLKRIAHVGLIEEVKGGWVHSIEGNTNLAGSREGDGVYRRIRHKRTIYKYADWL